MKQALNRQQKILYVITKSNWGGAQRYVFDLATNLPSEFEPVVACGGGGALVERLRSKGVRVVEVPGFQRDISFLNEVRAFFFLRRLFKAEKPGVVHLNSSKAAALGALAARLGGVRRIIFTVHGWPFLEQRNPLSCGFIYFFSWLTAALSHEVIVVSDHDLRITREMPFVSGKSVRIYSGIGPIEFGSGDVIRRAFPAGAKITGAIGELNANKNHIALIEQAKKDPAMCVAIVGEGELRDFLQKKIHEYGLTRRVQLFGFLPAAEVLKGFDRFALPSLKEGLPYVLLEAKQAGLPIVANRAGGVGEALNRPLNDFSLEGMLEKTSALYRLPAQAG